MTSTELETFDSSGETSDIVNRRDLRNRATDSWTDVLEDVGDLAARIANTDFVPATFKDKNGNGNVAAVAATILAGREVGFAPMTSLASMHSIKGKVGLYAEAMRALVFQAGHEIVMVESTSAQCEIKGRRAGSDQWTKVTWSIADARQAGLTNSNRNWQTYPRQMLQARASTELCRLVFPDVIRGLASVEELETLDLPPGAPGSSVGSDGETKPVKRATRKKAEAAVAPTTPLPEEAATQTGAESEAGPAGEADPPAESDSAPPLPEDAATSPDAGSDVAVATPSPAASEPALPDEDDAVPADVVENEVEAEPRATTAQRPALMAGFTNLGVKDKAERMQITVDLIGREVASSNDLTMREAGSVIETLAMCKTRDELEAIIQATVGHREKGGA